MTRHSCSIAPPAAATLGFLPVSLPNPQYPPWTHSAPVSLTMPGHLSHCFLMLPALLRSVWFGSVWLGGCGQGEWVIRRALEGGCGGCGAGADCPSFRCPPCGDFSHFALRVQRVRGRNPFACLLKLPPRLRYMCPSV